jgi:exodeoxyribonuclease VIII
MKFKDVMIDLETMGTAANAAIVAIGAVNFDSHTGEIGSTFCRVVDLESSMAARGSVDAKTILWWVKQGAEAREAITAEGDHLLNVLQDFSRWLTGNEENAHLYSPSEVYLWGNGAEFDNAILASAYRNSLITLPWKFWNDRCYRTVKAMHPEIKMERTGTHHNALDDAVSQAHHLIAICKAAAV